MNRSFLTFCAFPAIVLLGWAGYLMSAQAENPPFTGNIQSLDGDWMLATDPQNLGKTQQWWNGPIAEAKPAKVPWIIQDAFPGYHGLAWYWRTFETPNNPHTQARTLLRFWAVDYQAEVWVNGKPVGSHEGAESRFEFDITELVKPGQTNQLAVRVLNPNDTPIDGMTLKEVPHRNKVVSFFAGTSYNQGGIMDSVELLTVPAARVEDLFAQPDMSTGDVRINLNLRNASARPLQATLELSIAPAREGAAIAVLRRQVELAPGDSQVQDVLNVPSPHRWDLNDPYLYRVTARLILNDPAGSIDEASVRFGFREFHFKDGYFRLNGRRIFLRSTHTISHAPLGLQLPHDPDLFRRDLLNYKVMGFNMVRFIAGLATRYQLDLCDEIGLMAYEEPLASWCLENSPKMAQRYDESILGMVRRDRNHVSIVIWGLLNETPDGPVFRHAVTTLQPLRAMDASRMVLLNSGRWDMVANPPAMGVEQWHPVQAMEPNAAYNRTDQVIRALGITWQPGQFSLHPGKDGEYGLLRWTAPEQGACAINATFSSIAEHATTDVHIVHNGIPVFDGFVNVNNQGERAEYAGLLTVAAGDTIDFAVGYGSGGYGADTTALAAKITLNENRIFEPGPEFSPESNPNGPWQYGYSTKEGFPKPEAFQPFAQCEAKGKNNVIGSLSNPGSLSWENVLHDQHCYPRVPHSAAIERSLRDYQGGYHNTGMGENGYPPPSSTDVPELPVFLSEYGIGSAVDLVHVTRHYEQLGAEYLEDAQYYRAQLDAFMNDWQRWNMADAFGRPEDYFAQCLAKMAGQRLLGFDAIRANPNFVGFNLTGAVDQCLAGEGLTTTFREFKPGAFDAVHNGWAPLRWCLFAEPAVIYSGSTIHLDAVLANEDALKPGDYPVRLMVLGPEAQCLFEKQISVSIPERQGNQETPFALPVFSEDVRIDGPAGAYRFVAAFERGAAAAGGEVTFYTRRSEDLPAPQKEVVIWGEDPALVDWLKVHGYSVRPFDSTRTGEKQMILAGQITAENTNIPALDALWPCVAQGSTAIFLSPGVFRKGDDPVGELPFAEKGGLKSINGWLYLKDEWAKRHPIFEGLPSGGLMDYRYYRELIPDAVFTGQGALQTAVAGANKTSQGYDSGLFLSIHAYEAGRVILNTLRIREQLGKHPAADRLLTNLIRFAASN